jgi:hypothetical protein
VALKASAKDFRESEDGLNAGNKKTKKRFGTILRRMLSPGAAIAAAIAKARPAAAYSGPSPFGRRRVNPTQLHSSGLGSAAAASADVATHLDPDNVDYNRVRIKLWKRGRPKP